MKRTLSLPQFAVLAYVAWSGPTTQAAVRRALAQEGAATDREAYEALAALRRRGLLRTVTLPDRSSYEPRIKVAIAPAATPILAWHVEHLAPGFARAEAGLARMRKEGAA